MFIVGLVCHKTIFVSPVRSNTFLGNLVHLPRSDLNLHPSPLGADDCGMERLVHIWFGKRYVVFKHKSIDEAKEGYYGYISGTDEQCKKALGMIKAKNPKTGEVFIYAEEVTGEEKDKVIKAIKEESEKASEAFGSIFG